MPLEYIYFFFAADFSSFAAFFTFGLSPPLAIFFFPYNVPFREDVFLIVKNACDLILFLRDLALLSLKRSKSVKAAL